MLLEENTYIDVRVKNIRLMSNDSDSSSPLKWSKEPCYSDPVTVKAQYNKLTEDWRHINTMTWGVPAVAVTVMSGLILAAYQPQLEGWPRIVSLGVGSLLLFALTIEVIKKRLLMSAISGKLEDLEGSLKFSASTGKLIDYVDNLYKNSCYTNPDQGDPIYRIFKWSYARQWLCKVKEKAIDFFLAYNV